MDVPPFRDTFSHSITYFPQKSKVCGYEIMFFGNLQPALAYDADVLPIPEKARNCKCDFCAECTMLFFVEMIANYHEKCYNKAGSCMNGS